MGSAGLRIGEVAARSGVSLDTLRYYERVGLLDGIARTPGGRRVFDDDDIAWLHILRCLRDTGMPIAQMRRYADLCREHGLGEAKAAQLKACVELARRLALERPEERSRIHSPEDIAALVSSEMAALDQEELRVVPLNTKNEVLRVVTVYRGSVNAAQVRVAEVFKEAVRLNAPALVVVHNHPSVAPRGA